MAQLSSRRKLAAILCADVVGYSRLMAADEAATVSTLKSCRDIIARLIARRGGRVVNAPGDALLAEFPSALTTRPPRRAMRRAMMSRQDLSGVTASSLPMAGIADHVCRRGLLPASTSLLSWAIALPTRYPRQVYSAHRLGAIERTAPPLSLL